MYYIIQLLDVSDDVNHLVEDQTHFDILLMHLIKKFHGLRGVLHLLCEENKEWWMHFTGFNNVKERLKVCFIILWLLCWICKTAGIIDSNSLVSFYIKQC